MRATSGAGLADGVGAGLDVGRGVWGEPGRPRTGELGDPVGAARVHAASATSESATTRGSRRVARDVTPGTLAGFRRLAASRWPEPEEAVLFPGGLRNVRGRWSDLLEIEIGKPRPEGGRS